MNPSLSYAVRELHIDLLFLEEFYSSKNFREWFIANTVGNDEKLRKFIAAKHSVFELERESDLEMIFQSEEGDVFFLIENKINAQFQSDQALDYKKRGLEYVRRGKCIKSYTVLFAPQNYIDRAKSIHVFDYYLSFEQVIEHFNSQHTMGERANYKIEVLKKAISKLGTSSRGIGTLTSALYQPSEINEGISLFWQNYWKDISERLPELHMPRPGVKGPAATFIGLAKNSLPTNVIIYHKFVHGYVDLQFERLDSRVGTFIHTFQNHLEDEMIVQKAGKAAVIRTQVPKINPHLDYDILQPEVHIAQDAAKRLFSWYLKHADKWEAFKSS